MYINNFQTTPQLVVCTTKDFLWTYLGDKDNFSIPPNLLIYKVNKGNNMWTLMEQIKAKT
jgi:hypothetical protein